jgi:FtsZ-binding cell division protein ZapB
MAFVRAKPRGEKVFYYLVKSERIGNRVRQKTVAYLGRSPTVAEAVQDLRNSISHARQAAEEWHRKAEDAKSKITPWAFSRAVSIFVHAPVIDDAPTFLYRGSPFNKDYAKQYHSHLRKARIYERWEQRLRAQLDKLQKVDNAV